MEWRQRATMAEPTTITMRVALVASEVVQSANASATMAIPRIICQRFICGLGLISDGFWNVRGEGVLRDMVTDWEVGCGDQFGAILRRFENQG
jgi:hypothetical protein